MNKKELSEYFKKIGAKGGKASKRKLTTEEAQEMARRSHESPKRKKKAPAP